MNTIKLTSQNKILLFSFLAFILIYIFLNKKNKVIEKNQQTEKFESADTFIPAGYVLVPIEIENVDSISGLIGSFALVDLYFRSNDRSEEMSLAAQKIKLIRAPLNPNQYAVLVTERESVNLLKLNPRFWVTLHNQKNNKDPGGVISNAKYINSVDDKKTDPNLSGDQRQLYLKKSQTSQKKYFKNKPFEAEVLIEYYEPKKAHYL